MHDEISSAECVAIECSDFKKMKPTDEGLTTTKEKFRVVDHWLKRMEQPLSATTEYAKSTKKIGTKCSI